MELLRRGGDATGLWLGGTFEERIRNAKKKKGSPESGLVLFRNLREPYDIPLGLLGISWKNRIGLVGFCKINCSRTSFLSMQNV